MKIKQLLFTIVFLFNIHILFSQNYLVIKGKVIDQTDSTNLAYANVYIEGTYVGVVTNEAGEFELKFPETNLKDSLVISCMGFTSFKQTLLKLAQKHESLIQLSPKYVNINEVIITPLANQPELIFKEALKRIKDNYPEKSYYLDVFFRETEYCENNYLRLLEAAIGVQDFGFDSNIERTRIKLLELRKSDDYLEYKLSWSLMNKWFGEENILYKSYSNDFLRYRGNMPLFGKNFDKQYQFVLDKILFEDNSLIYVIRYTPSTYADTREKPIMDLEGKLYIRGSDFAIIKAEFNRFINKPNSENPLLYDSKYYTKIMVSYRKINEKYYLNYIKCLTSFTGTPTYKSDDSEYKVQKTETSFYVTNIYTSSKDFDRVKRREKVEKDMDLYKKEVPYNKEFWAKYNSVLLNPVAQKLVDDLEKGKSLEKQFKDNGK